MDLSIDAVRRAIGRALQPISDGVLEAWTSGNELGTNVRALRMELQCAQWMLNNTRGNRHSHGREIQDPALAKLLQELLGLSYRADDALDELDYFRIQDELDGSYSAADEHGSGYLRNLILNARHTVQAIRTAGKNLPRFSAGSPVQNDANSIVASTGSRLLCCCTSSNKVSRREVLIQTPKLRFDRVEISREMKEIVEQLKHVCAKVSTILNNLEFLDSNCSVAQCISTRLCTNDSKNRWQTPMHRDAMSRPSKPIEPRFNGRMIEPRFNGRMELESKIIHDITMGECCVKDLTVLPIVGPGGIGKTTLAQHIFQELRAHFEVTLWVTVSINFNVYRLTKDIAYTLTDDIRDSPDKLVEERLKSKRFLLVLDDLWSCGDDEWRRFLVPFRRGQTKGSVILVTTRFRKIALMVKTTDSLIELEGLEHEAFRELFMSYAFGDDMQAQNDSGLIAIGDRILQKLKGSPLVAKTVGQLLRNNLTLDHWTRVLESKEWEFQIDDDNGIMAALKLSFDSLPSHLQQCLTYCALFPEDYKFRTEEIIHFWIGLDILHPSGVNERIEDIGLSVLKDLAVLGFFRKEEENGHTCYSIHDLIHDLALKVSAHDCLSIYSSGVRYLKIPPSVRHMAINIDDSSVKDKMTFASCKEDFSALFKRVKVENLHTLMLFGNHQGSFVKIFGDLLFNKARALRVIFISGETCSMEDYLLSNIWKFVHLWYLRIGCASLRSQLPNISTLYHLRVLDLQGCYKMCCNLPRDMGNLIKLRHLLIPDSERHSSIFKVGRLKELQELRRFEAKREIQGFELRQIGHLQDLRGSLQIENLERVEVKEANEAKLVLKNHLRRLTLDWNINRPPQDPACEEQVLEGLKPGSNLLELCISGHGGATCPSWLGVNLSVKNLESLRLDSVAWKIYPAIGELWLVNDHGEKLLSDTSNQGFRNLKRIELVNLVGLKKWVVNHQLFFHLEVLIIKDCPELVELSSRYSTCIGHEQQTWFPRLQELMIDRCPKLLSLPPVPWTCAALSVRITGVDLCFERLVYKNDNGCASSLEIEGKDSLNSASWMALDFHNLSKLEKLKMVRCPPMPLHLFRMLFSLKTLEISYSNIVFWPVEDESPIQYLFPVESMRICGLGANGKELTQLLSFMPKLLELLISDCERIAGLGIMEQRQKATPSSNEVETQIGWLQNSIEKEEIAVEGLLLLPPQLHELLIAGCPNLIILLPDSLVDDKESLLAQRAGCLQGLLSLLSLEIRNCPKCLSYLSSSPCFPFPNSLQKLSLGHVEGMETLLPLSNLTTLTELEITDCGDLRNEGLLNLLTPGSLTKLSVSKTPNFFCSGPLELHEEGLYFSSSRLRMLLTDDAGVLTAPICSLLSSSLTSLFLFENKEMEYFTKGQEESLMLLTSLKEFGFYDCDRLQCLPAVLHRLPNLKRLEIASSPAIQMLPKGGLPSSLEELKIKCCPAIRTLPKVGLPYSLRVLNVLDSNNEELRMQCRKLIGIIPIVEA